MMMSSLIVHLQLLKREGSLGHLQSEERALQQRFEACRKQVQTAEAAHRALQNEYERVLQVSRVF